MGGVPAAMQDTPPPSHREANETGYTRAIAAPHATGATSGRGRAQRRTLAPARGSQAITKRYSSDIQAITKRYSSRRPRRQSKTFHHKKAARPTRRVVLVRAGVHRSPDQPERVRANPARWPARRWRGPPGGITPGLAREGTARPSARARAPRPGERARRARRCRRTQHAREEPKPRGRDAEPSARGPARWPARRWRGAGAKSVPIKRPAMNGASREARPEDNPRDSARAREDTPEPSREARLPEPSAPARGAESIRPQARRVTSYPASSDSPRTPQGRDGSPSLRTGPSWRFGGQTRPNQRREETRRINQLYARLEAIERGSERFPPWGVLLSSRRRRPRSLKRRGQRRLAALPLRSVGGWHP